MKLAAQLIVVTLLIGVFASCHAKEAEKTSATQSPSEGGKKMATKTFTEPKKPDLEAGVDYQAIIKTDKGDITVDLFEKDAPLSVTNFKQLAEGGFYDGLTFHRVEPGFVIQGGDPHLVGRSGAEYTLPAEIKGNPHKHIKGALAWARTGDQVNPQRRSSGSQFYITLAATPFLDNAYTVFGQTIKGMDVVEKIQVGDKIKTIEIIKK